MSTAPHLPVPIGVGIVGLSAAGGWAARAHAQDRGLRTFVGLQAQSAPVVRYLRDLVAEGYVGEVLSTSMIASGGSWGATHDARSTYLLDRDNGATMLTIPFGHAVDGLALVLGEFTEITATMATRRPQVANHATGDQATMTAEDQVAVSGILQSGAVASVHFRGGLSRGTNLHWEINGTDGDLVVTGDTGHLQFGQVTLRGARGKDRIMADLPVPAQYDQVPELAGRRTEQAYTVAH